MWKDSTIPHDFKYKFRLSKASMLLDVVTLTSNGVGVNLMTSSTRFLDPFQGSYNSKRYLRNTHNPKHFNLVVVRYFNKVNKPVLIHISDSCWRMSRVRSDSESRQLLLKNLPTAEQMQHRPEFPNSRTRDAFCSIEMNR